MVSTELLRIWQRQREQARETATQRRLEDAIRRVTEAIAVIRLV